MTERKTKSRGLMIERSYGGDWSDWRIVEILEETKMMIRVRKWWFFSEWLPKRGLGIKLVERF